MRSVLFWRASNVLISFAFSFIENNTLNVDILAPNMQYTFINSKS